LNYKNYLRMSRTVSQASRNTDPKEMEYPRTNDQQPISGVPVCGSMGEEQGEGGRFHLPYAQHYDNKDIVRIRRVYNHTRHCGCFHVTTECGAIETGKEKTVKG